MPTDFDNLWWHCVKNEYEEYYEIYNRVMKPKFKNAMNFKRVPLRISFKGNNYTSSRALEGDMNLK